jgi:hypothetical protein
MSRKTPSMVVASGSYYIESESNDYLGFTLERAASRCMSRPNTFKARTL